MADHALQLAYASEEDALHSLLGAPGPVSAALREAGNVQREEAVAGIRALVRSYDDGSAQEAVQISASYSLVAGRKSLPAC